MAGKTEVFLLADDEPPCVPVVALGARRRGPRARAG